MDVNPEKTALVLIEYQNDFTSEGGALHGAVDEVMQETGMLENSRRVADEARRAGTTVVTPRSRSHPATASSATPTRCTASSRA